MKKLLHFLYIGLMLPLALACEKQNIEPTGEFIDIVSDTLEVQQAGCTNFSFVNKEYGTVELGNALGDYILVGFAENVSDTERYQLLSKYPRFKSIVRDINTNSGPVTLIMLKNNSTCQNAESLIKDLETKPQVNFAYPTFGNPDSWTGITNEFVVTVEGSSSIQKLKILTESTNTKIVMLLDEYHMGNTKHFIYILSADKYSEGKVLEMCTLFNQQNYVVGAEPNYIFQLPPFEWES